MPAMRAKLKIESVTQREGSEKLLMMGVCKKDAYPADGSDEDNTFAMWSPSVSLDITITNPVLIGKFKPGQVFYLDFTEAGV